MREMTKEQLLDMVDDLRHKLEKTESKLQASEGKNAEHQKQISKLMKEKSDDIVHREIVQPALAMGLLPDAIPDIFGAAQRDGWVTNEHGELEMRNRNVLG